MPFPYNDDEIMWRKHAAKLRERAYEYELMALLQKRLGQKTRKEKLEKEEENVNKFINDCKGGS